MSPIERKQLEETLDRLKQSVLEAFDRGLTEVEARWEQSAVDATRPGDYFVTREPGPTQRFTLTLHNPKEHRPEEWFPPIL